jgi:hypothetical protein
LLIPENVTRDIVLAVPEDGHTVSEYIKRHGLVAKRTNTKKHQTFLNKCVSVKGFPLSVTYEQSRTVYNGGSGDVLLETEANREVRPFKETFVRNRPKKIEPSSEDSV